MEPSHVLVALDGSPLADDALSHALAVYDCRVTVLNIITPLDATMSEGGILDPKQSRKEAAHERAERLIERAASSATGLGRPIETAVETGDPAEAIVDYAAQNDVDHIVMGSHGGEQGKLTRRLLGTVSTAVLAESSVSVSVIR